MRAAAMHDFESSASSGWSGPGREPADYCSREGAIALKDKIEAYWRERGFHVMVSLQNVGFHPAIRAARYDLRTDMVNGLPRGASAAPQPSSASADYLRAVPDADPCDWGDDCDLDDEAFG